MCILWPYARLCGIWLCLVVSVMYPMSLCEIMRDLVMSLSCFCYVSLGLVMFRLSLLFRLCSYSWLCIVYYIHDTILYKGYCLWFDWFLLIDTPCHRPVSYVLDNYLKNFLCIYSITGRWQPIASRCRSFGRGKVISPVIISLHPSFVDLSTDDSSASRISLFLVYTFCVSMSCLFSCAFIRQYTCTIYS